MRTEFARQLTNQRHNKHRHRTLEQKVASGESSACSSKRKRKDVEADDDDEEQKGDKNFLLDTC